MWGQGLAPRRLTSEGLGENRYRFFETSIVGWRPYFPGVCGLLGPLSFEVQEIEKGFDGVVGLVPLLAPYWEIYFRPGFPRA